VSEQIRKLEAELGVLLLQRTQRSVALTEAGAVFLDDARHVLRQADVAQNAARRARDGVFARLRIGYVPDALPAIVPQALLRLRESAPAIDVKLEAGGARELLSDVRAERLDAAIVCLPAPVVGLRVHDLGHEEAVVAMAAWHRRAEMGPMTLADLDDERLLVMARDMNPAFYDAIVGAFRELDLTPTLIESTAPVIEHALLEVASGSGIALLPGSVAERVTTEGVAFQSLAGAAPRSPLALVTRDEDASTPIQSFLHELARTTHIARRRALRTAATA
jgi:DNA-binding transcriptional LysR family regulator